MGPAATDGVLMSGAKKVSMAHTVAKGPVDGEVRMLPPGAMSGSVILLELRSMLVHGPYYHQKPCGGQRCVPLPKTMLMPLMAM